MSELASAAPEAPQSARGRPVGVISVWLWVAAFVIGGAVTAVFLSIPKDAPSLVHNIATGVFLVVVFLLAPLAHITGFIFGLMAAFRPAERRGAGIVGASLNGLTIGGAVLVIWAVLSIRSAWR